MAARQSVTATSQNVGYVEGLDHLRGFAAFVVLFHHSYWVALAQIDPRASLAVAWPRLQNPLWAPLTETHFVIGVFFVISGFIFTLATYDRVFSWLGYPRTSGPGVGRRSALSSSRQRMKRRAPNIPIKN